MSVILADVVRSRHRTHALHADPSPPFVTRASDGGGVLGYVVIDSKLRGRAHGGLRLSLDVSQEQLSALARTMTLKYGYLRLPFGGAKAGAVGDPDAPAERRQELLNRFLQAITPLLRSKVYVPAPDMGTDSTMIRTAMQAAGAYVSPRQMKVSRSGEYTALTVFHSLRLGAASRGMELAGKSAAIEGFGKVGAPLARMLAEAGVRVVAVSSSRGGLYDPQGLDVTRLAELAASGGSNFVDQAGMGTKIPCDVLLSLPVDFLLPCAGFHSIHDRADVQARVVCPGANNPITPAAEASLVHRGVMLIPDFVANCGGVLGSVLEFACLPFPSIRDMVAAHVAEHLPRLIGLATQQGNSLRETAEGFALRRFQAMETESFRREIAVLAPGSRDVAVPPRPGARVVLCPDGRASPAPQVGMACLTAIDSGAVAWWSASEDDAAVLRAFLRRASADPSSASQPPGEAIGNRSDDEQRQTGDVPPGQPAWIDQHPAEPLQRQRAHPAWGSADDSGGVVEHPARAPHDGDAQLNGMLDNPPLLARALHPDQQDVRPRRGNRPNDVRPLSLRGEAAPHPAHLQTWMTSAQAFGCQLGHAVCRTEDVQAVAIDAHTVRTDRRSSRLPSCGGAGCGP